MKTNRLMAACVLLGGMVWSGVAHALPTPYNQSIGSTKQLDTNITTGDPSTAGTFHVTIQSFNNGTDFKIISIYSNKDGTPNQDAFDIHHVTISFFGGLNAVGTPLTATLGSGFGGTTPGNPTTPSDPTTGTWTVDPGASPALKFNLGTGPPVFHDPTNPIGVDGSNAFVMSTGGIFGPSVINVSGGAPKSYRIAVEDGSVDWSARVNLTSATPEPGSLALVLPGLVPLGVGLTLRRRRSIRS